MKGSTFQRCGCRDENGRQRGAQCPLLGRKGHGGWWFRYDVPRSVDGGRRQLRAGPFATRRDAEAALAETLDRVNKGIYIESDRRLTFASYLDEWLAGKLSLKATTRLSYVHHITLYLKPGLGHIRLSVARHGLPGAVRRDATTGAARNR